MSTCTSALFHAFLRDINTDRAGKGLTPCDSGESNRNHHDYIDSFDYLTHTAPIALLKKFVDTADTKGKADRRRKALDLFKACNSQCAVLYSPYGFYQELINEMRRISEREISHDYDWQSLLSDGLSVGPGASVGSQGNNSFFEKLFTNSFTTTNPALYTEYRTFVGCSPTLTSAELRRILLNKGQAVRLVEASSTSTVPKTSGIDRTICTEPSLNMIFQLALGSFINRRLARHYGYDRALQPDRNRKLAYIGSKDGSTATIDLKSASDTIRTELCRQVLPSSLMAAIDDCRCSHTRIGSGELVELHMVSSMGNGFTFPLQTYIFSLMIKAFCRLKGIDWNRYNAINKFGVFGDDIIVPSNIYDGIVDCLESLGFTVNRSKSFATGSFRESCGRDWYNGVNVRGCYIRKLDTVQDIFSAVNRLNRWSARAKVPLPQTITYLLGLPLAKGWRRFIIPNDLADTAGIKVPQCLQNRITQHYQYYSPKRRVFKPWFTRKLAGEVCSSFYATHDNPLGFMLSMISDAQEPNDDDDYDEPELIRSVVQLSQGLARRPPGDAPRYVHTKGFTPCWDSPSVALGTDRKSVV